jgi:hypothetical protein
MRVPDLDFYGKYLFALFIFSRPVAALVAGKHKGAATVGQKQKTERERHVAAIDKPSLLLQYRF